MMSYPVPSLALPRPIHKLRSNPPDATGYARALIPLDRDTTNLTIEDTDYTQRGGQFLMIGQMNGRHVQTLIRNCAFRFNMKADPHGRSLSRMYGMVDPTIEDSLFENSPEEHGIYWELEDGTTTFRRCTFRNLHSNAIQQRIDDVPVTNAPHWNNKKILVVEDCNFLECATNLGTRPAFVLSPKTMGPNSEVHLKNVFIQTIRGPEFTYGGNTYNSYGGGCFELMRLLRGENVTVDLKNPRNECMQLFDYSWFMNPKSSQNAGVKRPPTPQHVELYDLRLGGGHVSVIEGAHDRVRIFGKDGQIKIMRYDFNAAKIMFDRFVDLETGYSVG